VPILTSSTSPWAENMFSPEEGRRISVSVSEMELSKVGLWCCRCESGRLLNWVGGSGGLSLR